MSLDAGVGGPLSRTIADFREEVLLGIDNALGRLREEGQEQSLAMEEKVPPATLARSGLELESQARSRADRPAAILGAAVSEPAMRREGSRKPQMINGPGSLDDPPRPAMVEAGPETSPSSSPSPSDSLKRLDALARLLDQRLKVSQEAASNSSGASPEAAEPNG